MEKKINNEELQSRREFFKKAAKGALLLISIICFTINTHAQSTKYQTSHAIEVERFTNWAPEYLTVTNNYNNMTFEPMAYNLKCMSVITEINGQSTEDMDVNEFYHILDSSPNVSLTYLTKINGKNKEYQGQFTCRKGHLLYSPTVLNAKPVTLNVLSDADVDFFKFNTFDYRLSGDDQLMDKTLMEHFSKHLQSKGLKRVTENPDLYLYVTKDVNQKIESIYVPQYQTTTSTTGSSVGMGNFLGVRGLNVGGSSGSASSVTRDMGGMRTNVSADAYLEFSILDAKRLDNQSAPIIWQLTYSEHKTQEIRLLEAVKEWIGSWMLEYPFHENVIHGSAYTWGLFVSDLISNPIVTDVVPNSTAANMGVHAGDKIKYVKYLGTEEESCIYRPGGAFYASKIISTADVVQVGKVKANKGGLTEIVNYYYYSK